MTSNNLCNQKASTVGDMTTTIIRNRLRSLTWSTQYRGQIRAVLHDNLVRLETTFLASMIDANPTASTRLSV